MSASLAPDPWEPIEHEPTAADHAGVASTHADMAMSHAGMAAQHASQAELNNRSAQMAAMNADAAHGRAQAAHDGTAQQCADMMGQMDAWRQHIEGLVAMVTQQVDAAIQESRALAASSQQSMQDMHCQMLAAFQAIAATMNGPKKITVTKRGANGAIEEATATEDANQNG